MDGTSENQRISQSDIGRTKKDEDYIFPDRNSEEPRS